MLSNWRQVIDRLELMQQANLALSRMSREIRTTDALSIDDHRTEGNAVLSFHAFDQSAHWMYKYQYYVNGVLYRLQQDYDLRADSWLPASPEVFIGSSAPFEERVVIQEGDFQAIPLTLDAGYNLVELKTGDISETVAFRLRLTVTSGQGATLTTETIVALRK